MRMAASFRGSIRAQLSHGGAGATTRNPYFRALRRASRTERRNVGQPESAAMDRPTPAPEASLALGPPELTCFRLWPTAPELKPARADRDWMDLTHEHYAYRCIPLSIAN